MCSTNDKREKVRGREKFQLLSSIEIERRHDLQKMRAEDEKRWRERPAKTQSN